MLFILSFHSSQVEQTHPIAAVHSGDEHDSRQDDEAGDEEAHHQAGAAQRTL